MNTLYFYSHNDGVIRHSSIQDLQSIISIINQVRGQTFLKVLKFKTSIVYPLHLF